MAWLIDLIHETQFAAPLLLALTAFAVVFALGNFVAPFMGLAPQSRRLRDQMNGGARKKAEKRSARDVQGSSVRSLRSSPSEWMSRIGALFRISHRLGDGKLAARLMQAGLRGRPAIMKYLMFRLIAPVALFGVGLMLATTSLPGHAPLYQKIGCVVACTVFGYYLPPLMLKNQIDKRKVDIGRAWPDAVDLLLICVETGMSIEHAFKRIAQEMAGTSLELAKEMSLANAELNYLQERRQAYENMANRIDLEAVRSVMGCLIQSEKYGTSLGVSLRVLAQESREMRMAAAEKKAAALPPKLTVPMILFFLPVLFAVIITPAVLQVSN